MPDYKSEWSRLKHEIMNLSDLDLDLQIESDVILQEDSICGKHGLTTHYVKIYDQFNDSGYGEGRAIFYEGKETCRECVQCISTSRAMSRISKEGGAVKGGQSKSPRKMKAFEENRKKRWVEKAQ